MEKLAAAFVNEISNVTGVRAAYQVNYRGEILCSSADKLGRSLLTPASAMELVHAMGIFELAGEEINEMEIDFLEGKVLVYQNLKLNFPTRLGVHETMLVVVGEKNFNKAHLRLALNVLVSSLVADKKYKRLEAPVKIKKTSVLTRDKLADRDFAAVEKVRSLLT